jgi:protein-S-isoprenylcysteine O-methyltransferase Ste14
MSIGVAVILRELTPFIIVVIEFFVFDKYLIPPEEKVLEKNFGQRYKDYRQKVRRWI